MPQTASTSSSSFVWGCMVCSNTFVGENGFHTHFSRISAKEAKGGAGLHLLAAGAKDVTPLWRRIPLEAKYAWPERMLLDSTQWDLVRAYLKGPDGGIKKIRAALDDYLVHVNCHFPATPPKPLLSSPQKAPEALPTRRVRTWIHKRSRDASRSRSVSPLPMRKQRRLIDSPPRNYSRPDPGSAIMIPSSPPALPPWSVLNGSMMVGNIFGDNATGNDVSFSNVNNTKIDRSPARA